MSPKSAFSTFSATVLITAFIFQPFPAQSPSIASRKHMFGSVTEIVYSLVPISVLVKVFIAVIKRHAIGNLGRKEFIFLLLPYHSPP